MDKHSKEQRRKNMQAIKSKGSKIEILLGKALWSKGLRYRKNYARITGKPDFVFLKLKIAVFCDSEFFHGKDWDTKKHEIRSNIDFWHTKIERNIQRDKEVNEILISEGWIVLRFWAEDIKQKLDYCVGKVESAVSKRKSEI